ncbi:hypothetical protein [Pseudoalteromonas prydzensis]|uniref:Uncharacterized protein n=1 Tax=Pseudoalteromonas prydzensis TaxID=182141 RepID=A0ABR9FSZ8_9GAMM|nr:hypothetical protein [Pseudoalteromonas prydzensis]MBE0459945.1 hypothetical protein [Pseudoalteromonas prydzensis]
MENRLLLPRNSSYSPLYEDALVKLEVAAINSKITKGPQKKVFHRIGFWSFFVNLELGLYFFKVTGNSVESNPNEKLADNLGEYLSVNCNGDIELAIQQIDGFIKEVSFWMNDNNDYETLELLQMLSCYLRDISTITTLYNVRPERYRKDKPRLSKEAIWGGFCLLCSRHSQSKNGLRCHQHIKTRTNEYKVRKIQNKMNKAYKNGHFMRHEDNYRIFQSEIICRNKNEAFNERCLSLEGWAQRQPIQRSFLIEIEVLETKLLGEFIDTAIPRTEMEKFSTDLISICRKYEHTIELFNCSNESTFHFSISSSPLNNLTQIFPFELVEDQLFEHRCLSN